MSKPQRISVLLVDDHSLVRRGFRRILEDDAEILVAGEASDGIEAVDMALKIRPQVIVMDYSLPRVSGVLATRRILDHLPDTAILMLSMHSEQTCVKHALDAGARGYILKNAMDLDLVNAIKRVAAGERFVDPSLSAPSSSRSDDRRALTTRELEIMQLLVEGKSAKEIAAQLDLSQSTVAAHRANIMDALGIHKTAELVVYAIRNGLVILP
jgi:DNA-binding NarL/FixJ family response regulator